MIRSPTFFMGTLEMLLREKIPINKKCKFSLQPESKPPCARNNDIIEEMENDFNLKLKQ